MTARVPVAGVQPSVLRWARESQGYSIDDVAQHLKRDPAEIAAWESESSDAAPTYAQLEDLAYTLYKRPLAVFFLPAPPREPVVKQEFRTLPDLDLEQLAADTRYQIRLARAFQLSLKELNDGVNPSERKIFREMAVSVNVDVRKAALQARESLGITLANQSAWKSTEDALAAWRNMVEENGVFVFKHSFKQKAISGFCLADEEFPVIYLNNSTAKVRQIFSLFHELAHLLLRVNAISKFDRSYVDLLPQKEKRIEQFCNAFAAELLVPFQDFGAQVKSLTRIDDRTVAQLAWHYHVSREVILRRILDRGLVDQTYYETKVRQWAAEKEDSGSGGNANATQASYLGEKYLRLVFGKHYQGKINLEQVADYLGVRSKRVAELEAIMLRKAAA